MKITKILSFLSYPSKHQDEQPEIGGSIIAKNGRLFEMLKEIFEKSHTECNIPICFTHSEDGKQSNEFRDLLIEIIKNPNVATGRKFAERLQNVTTGKSGMGLLFIILAQDDTSDTKIMFSRFPADQGIMAEQSSKTLKVAFIEQVFLKNAHAYKAVVYQGMAIDGDLWTGHAVDRQTNHGAKEIANYWIKDFLVSDFAVTSKAGTKRLAVALKNAVMETSNLEEKHEITSSAVLAKNLDGKNLSINDFVEQLHLSDSSKELVFKQLKNLAIADEKFTFDVKEFRSHISYRSLEIDNGAIISAPMETFDDCFQETKLEESGQVEFKTIGKVKNEKLKKTR